VDEKTDFALAFYCVHEISGKKGFFEEMAESLKPGGRMLVVEPPFHVSKAAFQKTLDIARTAGFELVKRPRVLLSKTAVLERRR
jgi:hypothetical protein